MSLVRKRAVPEEWACPVCLETIGDGCVPAVMNGCTPFAHVACTKCLAEIKSLGVAAALCPKCRAPFSTFRPLADFVDADDVDVASELKRRRQSSASLVERIDALALDDPLLKQRVTECARLFELNRRNMPLMETQIWTSWGKGVPAFDAQRAALTLADAKKCKINVKSRVELKEHLDALTASVLPSMHMLYPKFAFVASTATTLADKRLGYLAISSIPKL
jgi:hypothetical protein